MDPAVALTLRLALILLFLSAAVHKVRAPAAFRATLADYRLLPERALTPVALGLVLAEIGIAAALLLPGARAAIAAAGLLGLYTLAIAVNLARGRRHIDCGCGGPAADQPLSEWHLVRNGALLGVTFACMLPSRMRPLVCVDGLSAVAAVTVLTLLWAAAHRMIANAPHLARLRG